MDEKLEAALQKLKDFSGKSSMSETERYVMELEEMAQQIEQFKEEVRIIKVNVCCLDLIWPEVAGS